MAEINQSHKIEQNFDEYRRNMHREEDKGRAVVPESGKAVKIGFAILMIIVYVGMGILLLINFFNWTPGWAVPRYVVGIMLIIYGVFRCYRQFISPNV